MQRGFSLWRWMHHVILCFLLTLVTVAPATAQEVAHPLFTGPVHTTPEPLFDQTNLLLSLRLDPAARQIFGDALLHVQPLDTSLDTLVLHARDLVIDSVLIGMTDSSKVSIPFYTRGRDSLLIPLHMLEDPTTAFEVQIVYSARPRRGLYFVTHEANGQHQIWSHNAPATTRYWIPLIDVPGDKLTAEMLITADSSLRVFSTGQFIEETLLENGQRRTHYRQDQPIAPHQIVLAAGSYDVMPEVVRTVTNDQPVPLSYWVYPERRDDASRTFANTPAMMRFFADWLDMPYPWETYAQIVLHHVLSGGLSYAGAAGFSDTILLDNRAVLDEDPSSLLASELAHQWFGGLVTVRSWSDSWLHEGLAMYLSALFVEAHDGPDALALMLSTLRAVYLDEATRYLRPLRWNRWTDPAQVFDVHSTHKGAWVMHMLHERLGDNLFREMLTYYLKEYALSSADTEDFKVALETVSGQNFDAFFAQWVDGAGHPVLHVSYEREPGNEALSITVEQQQEGTLVPDVFPMELPVTIHTLTDTLRFALPIEDRSQTLTLPLTSPPRFVMVDPAQTILAEVTVDQPVQAWVSQLRDAPSPAHRLDAARALHAFLDDPALLIGLRSALAAEQIPAVRVAIVDLLSAFPPHSAVRRVLVEAFEDEEAHVRAAILDALGAYDQDQQVHDLALEAAQNDQSYRVQAAAVTTLARTGFPGAYDVIRSALITPSHRDVIRQAAFEALAYLDISSEDGLALALQYTPLDYSSEVRSAAARYLQTLAVGSRAALEHLIYLLDDDDRQVRRAAITSLGGVHSERARTALRDHLETEVEPGLRLAIMNTLRASSNPTE